MTPEEKILRSEGTQPENLWFIGYEHLTDSMRRDTDDTPAERAQAAQTAALMFASAQARALAQIADRLAEMVEHQRAANLIAAFTGRAITNDAEWHAARELVNDVLFPNRPTREGDRS
ncbi:hypothetical protein [Nocardia sp. NPDC050793]|uniref:hypothetical protein n=1 Tax=Nocardia sp. NPDC050793 TaxID=3155159 RepID=UPI0033EE2445